MNSRKNKLNSKKSWLFFFFDVKLITLIHTKNKKVHPGTPIAHNSLVFPQPKHFDLTHLLQIELTCVQPYSLTKPHDQI